MKEFLDSDRVNFLVWRYLLEGNYRETAAKFQKEWRVQEPHRHFDFAPHVKSHALVSTLNRGLLYYSFERDFAQSQKPQSSQTLDATQQPFGVFGPLITQQPPPVYKDEDVRDSTAIPAVSGAVAPHEAEAKAIAPAPAPAAVAAATAAPAATAPAPAQVPAPAAMSTAGAVASTASVGDESDSSRKRHIDKQQQATQNGLPTKKPRLSNGHNSATVGAAATTQSGTAPAVGIAPPTPMDIDSNSENQHGYPSPMERDSAPTPVQRTEGPEQGTQVDKVEELAPETIFLRLTPDHSTADNSATDPHLPGQENPIVLHCEWNPSNPSVLAAAGTDALARIWTLSRSATTVPPDHVSNHVNGVHRPYRDLVDEDMPPTSTITAMAWNHDGSTLALATESGAKASVSIWGADGTALLRFNVQEPPVIKLRWNPNGASLLGILPDNGGTLVTVFSAITASTVSYFLPDYEEPLDAAWMNETDFIVCGGDVLLALRCTDNAGIVIAKKFSTRKDDSFVQVQYDSIAKIIATASEKGLIDLWDESGERRTISAHIGVVTALMWQPLQSAAANDERLLASGGEDGAITIWNARIPDSKPKCSMTMDLPVVALAFTPDGAFIAGATAERILIWKVGDHSIPRASWRQTAHPGWLSPKVHSDSEEEDTHCLCWDTTGQKLAYGVNNRLAVINFR